MLRKLSIQNYAIIEELEVDFSSQLTIITGETGAGKSIIMGALGLILGERADSTVLVNKEKKSVVEGIFLTKGRIEINAFLEKNELDVYEELVLRREISPAGKSRAFINDTPVSLAQLQVLSSFLVDLHQQFDTLSLGDAGFQRQVLDALAGNAAIVNEYQELFKNWQQATQQYDGLAAQKLQFEKEADYNSFQYKELEEAGFKENEIEEIDTDVKLLSHAEGIKSALTKIYYELEEGEAPVVQQLKSHINQLTGLSSYHAAIPALLQRLQTAQIELKDIAGEIETLCERINYDPQQIERMNERLSLGYKLQKKHGVASTAELLNIQQQLQEKLQAVLDIDDQIAKAGKEKDRWYKEAEKTAKEIAALRSKQVKPLEEKVNKLLVQVGMPNAKIKVAITTASLHLYGGDTIEFLFDANKSGSFQPVRKVASGGELSRLMLCIKSLVAQSMDMPTLIFDEIDSGISGEAARQVGIIMKSLAASRQVICITHQPQIAGKADTHYFVYKEIVKDTVKTNIRILSMEERITAIAKMLSGEQPTAAAIENAREMVNN